FGGDAVVPHVADDADDGDPGTIGSALTETPADGLLARPVLLCHRLVDQRHVERSLSIRVAQPSSFNEMFTERLGATGGGDLPVARRTDSRRRRVALDRESPVAN